MVDLLLRLWKYTSTSGRQFLQRSMYYTCLSCCLSGGDWYWFYNMFWTHYYRWKKASLEVHCGWWLISGIWFLTKAKQKPISLKHFCTHENLISGVSCHYKPTDLDTRSCIPVMLPSLSLCWAITSWCGVFFWANWIHLFLLGHIYKTNHRLSFSSVPSQAQVGDFPSGVKNVEVVYASPLSCQVNSDYCFFLGLFVN